jgi:hypothetical protein
MHHLHYLIIAGAGVLVTAGCASNDIQAEWSDPQFGGHTLAGERVLAVCDASETTIKRVCEDQLAVHLTAAGITPVKASDSDIGTIGTGAANSKALSAARDANAKAVFAATVAPDATVVNSGPTVGFGVGGFGGYPGGMGAGVGVSTPVGPGQVNTAYGANMALTDVATGRLIWTGKVTGPASRDVSAQIGELTEKGVTAARKAGML